jgi:hypothetical protein
MKRIDETKEIIKHAIDAFLEIIDGLEDIAIKLTGLILLFLLAIDFILHHH